MIEFTVPAVPVAQPRQRHAMIGGHIRNYTPSKHPVQDFKTIIKLMARQAYTGRPLEGPLALTVVFVMPRPGRLMWKKRPMPRVEHCSKPDLDNLVKAVKDALNQLLWKDDGQIAKATLAKVYASGDEQPHVDIKVQPIEV